MGDGSGSTWARAAGWGSIMIAREQPDERLVFSGGVNYGTVNFAEIMAFLHPLIWLASCEEDYRREFGVVRSRRVHILTDSEYCRNTGNERRTPAKNSILWKSCNAVQLSGILLKWHWIERNTADLHAYADRLSKLSRELIESRDLVDVLIAEDRADGRDATVYDYTPTRPA